MKFTDLLCSKDYVLESVECTLQNGERVSNDSSGTIEEGRGETFVFRAEDKDYRFTVDDPYDRQFLSENLKLYSCLAKKISRDSGNNGRCFSLRAVFFARVERFSGRKSLSIMVGDELQQELMKKTFIVPNSEQLFKQLAASLTIEDMDQKYFVYVSYEPTEKQRAGKDADEQTEETEDDNSPADDEDSMIDASPDEERTVSDRSPLILYGEKCILTVSLKGREEEKYLQAVKVHYNKYKKIPCFCLGIGEISFSDEIEYTSQKVQELLKDNSTYLSLWDMYSAKEGEVLLQKVRAVGLLNLDRKNAVIEGKNLRVPTSSTYSKGLLKSGDCLDFNEEELPYLSDPNMTWEEWKKQSVCKSRRAKSGESEGMRKIEKIQRDCLILEGTSPLPEARFVSLSIKGDEAQIRRRERCRETIRTGRAANPNLALIIEGIGCGENRRTSGGKHIAPITPLILQKIFKHPPTSTQRHAIDIALNTPDIAIIQGPPGTGKTTVITAIIERLNELSDKKDDICGDVLVTSMQHDAVINIQERISVNSLPAVKFGKSSKQEQEESLDFATEEWCGKKAEELRLKHTGLQQSSEEDKFSSLYHAYLAVPADENALSFLEYARSMPISAELDEKIKSIIDEIKLRAGDDESQDLILTIRRLRTTRDSFLDDGADNALALYVKLEKMIDKEKNSGIFSLLRQAATAAGESDISADLLDSLKQLRGQLLEKCIPLPFYRQDIPRHDVSEIFSLIKPTLHTSLNAEDSILYAYLNELEQNTDAVRSALKKYCFVFTATLQQSQGEELRTAKIGNDKGKEIRYDTVIVDEAARANPGDLMIPLTQAKKRIILVGDHRQLPHLYDEEIFEQLQSLGTVPNENDIKTSMFEHLLYKAKELQKNDHIERFITLDAQYRMHPLLGRFVSDQFYSRYGEGFESPLEASYFQQSISPSPVRWINLPPEAGKEIKYPSGSRCRECEVYAIFDRLEKYLNDSAHDNLTFGVISFYSAQVEEIKKLFAQKGSEKSKSSLKSGRLRIGSVDSFQGMEFDVIFLSVVRSGKSFAGIDLQQLEKNVSRLDENDEERKAHDMYVEKTGISCYGFLTSENRLCVALSRQKRLLIVVGDKTMFVGGAAERTANICVPSLPALYHLCEAQGAVDECKF